MGREVKRPPQGSGGRGHTDVFTPTLRNGPSRAPERHSPAARRNEKSAHKALFSELVGRAGCASARPGPRPAGDAMHQPESLPAIQSNLRRFSSCTLAHRAQKRKKRLKGAFL